MRAIMNSLARETLMLLIESGQLREAGREQLVAYETYYLPPKIDLSLPDKDRYSALLNPHTTRESCKSLASAILTVVATEERDTWLRAGDGLEVVARLATGRDSARATPIYADDRVEQPARVSEIGDPLLQVEIGDHREVLRQGMGLLTVVRSRWRPRVSLMEAPRESPEVAFLVTEGPTLITTADGREREHEGPAKVPLTHDVEFRVRGRGVKFWQRPVEGRIEVLGVSRMTRPTLMIEAEGGVEREWDRNREPTLDIEIGEASSQRTAIQLRSGAGDQVDIEIQSGPDTWLTWHDGRPLRVSQGEVLPVLGAHLVGLGRENAGLMRVRMTTALALSAPLETEIHGWMPPLRKGGQAFAGLFGFEQPVAVIYEDGLALDAGDPALPARMPVYAPELVGPLFKVALDQRPGCKLLPLNPSLNAEGVSRPIDAWSWIQGVVAFSTPGSRWRLEALDRPRIIYGEPLEIARISADPADAWRIQGWRVRVVGDTLEIGGDGREPAILDRKPVTGELRVPMVGEHRLQIGRGIYRVVRRTAPEEEA